MKMLAPGSVRLKTMPDDPDPSPTSPLEQGPFRGPDGAVETLTDAAFPVRILPRPRPSMAGHAAFETKFVPVRSIVRRAELDPRPSGTGAREFSWNG
jgi:hypothetical protein